MIERNNIVKGIAKRESLMMGVYHCFALAFEDDLNLDSYHHIKMKWKSFQRKNREKKKQYLDHGKGWFYDHWLLKRIKYSVYSFGYLLEDVEILMPTRMHLLIIKINPDPPEVDDRRICILISPRGTEDSINAYHKDKRSEQESQLKEESR